MSPVAPQSSLLKP